MGLVDMGGLDAFGLGRLQQQAGIGGLQQRRAAMIGLDIGRPATTALPTREEPTIREELQAETDEWLKDVF